MFELLQELKLGNNHFVAVKALFLISSVLN